ncbi:hypothetical protein GCM10008018_23530 [Paenibacillus marchantiophytorum]|uniref:Uncharacterized protein n=1 Tax=Paenibacillus marchantiophytorum TaxID=1619310 RepID=A0ABQ1ELZ5_9BACL|nr:hypothetical protein GCM10008018_23530 [Paenibacillus marchantiophytorum]
MLGLKVNNFRTCNVSGCGIVRDNMLNFEEGGSFFCVVRRCSDKKKVLSWVFVNGGIEGASIDG